MYFDSPDEIYGDCITVTYSDIQGGYTDEGNIDQNPVFVGGGDYHLQFASPCIDVGTNNAPEIPDTDFEGDSRIIDGNGDYTPTVDMGADEYTPPDMTPPTVSSTTPANDATDVAWNTTVTAAFSEAMDASTITTATFLVNDGTSNIPGTVTYSDTTATFTPAADLDYDTTYTATITTGAEDLAGNPLETDYTWSFTTSDELPGNFVTSDLWIKAVIKTEEKGPIEAVWQKGREDTTSRGDRVIWGHFYASPNDVTWGSENNPDLFVKIWFDVSGRIDVNFFHVSVPDIEVYSDYPYDGTVDEQGTTTMDRRYIRQYYENGQSNSDENYEDGNPPSGYSPAGNPSGFSTINDLRIGSIINTVEKGPIDAVWRLGGQDTTSRGDQVVWGHFYASPTDVTWGSENNPDLFVKIWFDVRGRIDVNYFHVSVPDIEIYSDYPENNTYDQKGTSIMDNRYIRHEYWR